MAISTIGPAGIDDDPKESGKISKIKRGAGGLVKDGETTT